jgi:hypothetical protein
MDHVVFIGFVALVSWLFALLEIQIEGRHGWAQNLPTWRIDNKWTRAVYKKPFTGYHLYAQGFIFLMAHSPFGLNLVLWNSCLRFVGKKQPISGRFSGAPSTISAG